jgi:hypothetical protein
MAIIRGETGAEFFDRVIAEYGKRRHVRDQVLAGADDARKGNLTTLARGLLENRDGFIKHFDALEEGSPEAVFAAIEAAFRIGVCMAATRFRKEVPLVQAAVAQRGQADKAAPRKAVERDAVRTVMKSSQRTPAISEKYARLIEDDVFKELGRRLSITAIKRYVGDVSK